MTSSTTQETSSATYVDAGSTRDNREAADSILPRFGFVVSSLTSLSTLTTFGLAIIAVPPTGPFCIPDYSNTCIDGIYRQENHEKLLAFWPHDYYWIFSALFQLLFYLGFIVAVHQDTCEARKVFSLLALSLSVMTCMVLFVCYFLQLAIIQPTLLLDADASTSLDSISIMTMYNDHGAFIALEETGYLFMCLSFLSLSFTLVPGKTDQPKNMDFLLRTILRLAGISGALALPWIVYAYGWDRSYRYEVVIITIDWLTLIAVGALWAFRFREQHHRQQQMNTKSKQS